jgi:molybdate transport system regulatory protein
MPRKSNKKASPQLRTPARQSPAQIKARVWVENAGGKPILTEAAADLLEQIEVCGSLSEAARRLRFSYRRAWLLADLMNRGWPEPLVVAATGGKNGGGMRLTEHGHKVLAAYRDVQIQIEHAIDKAVTGFSRATQKPS